MMNLPIFPAPTTAKLLYPDMVGLAVGSWLLVVVVVEIERICPLYLIEDALACSPFDCVYSLAQQMTDDFS
jgi:hypothetical protein